MKGFFEATQLDLEAAKVLTEREVYIHLLYIIYNRLMKNASFDDIMKLVKTSVSESTELDG